MSDYNSYIRHVTLDNEVMWKIHRSMMRHNDPDPNRERYKFNRNNIPALCGRKEFGPNLTDAGIAWIRLRKETFYQPCKRCMKHVKESDMTFHHDFFIHRVVDNMCDVGWFEKISKHKWKVLKPFKFTSSAEVDYIEPIPIEPGCFIEWKEEDDCYHINDLKFPRVTRFLDDGQFGDEK